MQAEGTKLPPAKDPWLSKLDQNNGYLPAKDSAAFAANTFGL